MPYSIAIAGCGVAGLTAALLLARQGHSVSLFEQSPTVGPAGAGILLQPSGQLVLERLGLLEQVTQNAEPIDHLHAITHRGKTLIDLPYAKAGAGLRAFGLHRGDLFTVLHRAVVEAGTSAPGFRPGATPRVNLQLDTRITRFTQQPGHIEIFDQTDASRGRFDFLLACDGSRSILREASGLAARIHEYFHGALWALGKSSVVRNKLFQVTRGTHQLCGLLPMGQDRCSLFWLLRKDQKDALFGQPFGAWKQSVIALVPQAQELLSTLHSFDDTRFTTYLHVRMPRWHTGRLLLLGDAAHAMSPHLGQGINLGLLDGLTLAHALEQSATPQAAFARYETLRRPHTNYYATITGLLTPFFQNRGVVKGFLRDLFLPLLPHTPWVAGQMLLTMTGLKDRICPVVSDCQHSILLLERLRDKRQPIDRDHFG